MGKARSDSQLKARAEQSPEFGEMLWDWLCTPKSESCVGGMQHARDQLKADGIDLGGGWRRKLSEFRSWWEMRLDFQEADDQAANVQELLKSLDLGLTTQQIDAAGQLVFTQRALASRDAEEFREMEKLRVIKESARSKASLETEKLKRLDLQIAQKEQELQLAKKKYQRDTCRLFLEWYADEQAKQIATGSGSNADKIEALGKAMFGEDWDA